jgi:sec-independent protein translocase protein TatA
MLPFNLGIPEVVVILGIALIIFGPKKLPELGRNLGKGLRNFKDSLSSAAGELKTGFNESNSEDNK